MLRGIGWFLVGVGVVCWVVAGAMGRMLAAFRAPRKTMVDWAAGKWDPETYTALGQRRLDLVWRLWLVGAVVACIGFIVVNLAP